MPYFATEDNCKIYYEESGEGEAVVFVHGWDCNRHFFKKQIPEFAKNYHVLAYDLRGHGDSDRPEKGFRDGPLRGSTAVLPCCPHGITCMLQS